MFILISILYTVNIKGKTPCFMKCEMFEKGGFGMGIEQRILTCRLLEKMNNQKRYSNKLGLENVSTFHGIQMNSDSKGYVKKV